jgi:hypothetical protein
MLGGAYTWSTDNQIPGAKKKLQAYKIQDPLSEIRIVLIRISNFMTGMRHSVHEGKFRNVPIVCGGLNRDITRSASVSSTDLLEGELNGALELGICEVMHTAVTWAIHTCRLAVSFVTVRKMHIKMAYAWGNTYIPFLSLFLQLIVTRTRP